jgi:hypothetical protein
MVSSPSKGGKGGEGLLETSAFSGRIYFSMSSRLCSELCKRFRAKKNDTGRTIIKHASDVESLMTISEIL